MPLCQRHVASFVYLPIRTVSCFIFPSLLLAHPNLALQLLMEALYTPHLRAVENILPRTARIPARQNILMHAWSSTAQHQRLPLAIARDLQLHAASDRLSDPECSPQALKLERVLRGGPLREAGFEGMCRVELQGLGGAVGCWADAGAEGVVQARG